jgi:hypothetical protein
MELAVFRRGAPYLGSKLHIGAFPGANPFVIRVSERCIKSTFVGKTPSQFDG